MAAANVRQAPAPSVSSASAASGFRTCFRLERPDTEADSADPECATDPDADIWTLHHCLQAADDPSVLVPAARVRSTRPALVGTGVERPCQARSTP